MNSGLTDAYRKECKFNRITHNFCFIKGLSPKKNGHPKRLVISFCFTRNDFMGDKDYSFDIYFVRNLVATPKIKYSNPQLPQEIRQFPSFPTFLEILQNAMKIQSHENKITRNVQEHEQIINKLIPLKICYCKQYSNTPFQNL